MTEQSGQVTAPVCPNCRIEATQSGGLTFCTFCGWPDDD